MMPEVSIVIPTYNHFEDCLKPCIESILKYTDMSKVEVIVVANGCNDGTVEYVRGLNHSSIHLIEFPEAMGYTRSTNAGIKAATGEYVMLLNNDCIVLPHEKHGWINCLTQPFTSDPKIGITGPSKLWCPHSKHWFIIFFCAMTKRSIIDQLGLLDETFNPGGGEDTEFSIRLIANGYKIHSVSPESEVWSYGTPYPIYHAAEQTVYGLPNWHEIFEANSRKLAERYGRKPKHSIVVLAPPKSRTIKRCVHSIWENTDYTQAQIIVAAYDNEESFLYAQGIQNFGPYKLVTAPTRGNRDEMIMKAIAVAEADLVTIIDGEAYLTPHDRDGWLRQLEKPFFEQNVAITTHQVNHGWASPFLLTVRKSLADGFADIGEFIRARWHEYRTVEVGAAYLGETSVYDPFPVRFEPD